MIPVLSPVLNSASMAAERRFDQLSRLISPKSLAHRKLRTSHRWAPKSSPFLAAASASPKGLTAHSFRDLRLIRRSARKGVGRPPARVIASHSLILNLRPYVRRRDEL